MLGSLGGPELLLIFVIALIVFGPRKLPEIGKTVGKMMAEFRKASNDFKQTIESEVEAEKLREAVRVDPFAPSSSSSSDSRALPEGGGGAVTPLSPEETGESAAGPSAESSVSNEPASPEDPSGTEVEATSACVLGPVGEPPAPSVLEGRAHASAPTQEDDGTGPSAEPGTVPRSGPPAA